MKSGLLAHVVDVETLAVLTAAVLVVILHDGGGGLTILFRSRYESELVLPPSGYCYHNLRMFLKPYCSIYNYNSKSD